MSLIPDVTAVKPTVAVTAPTAAPVGAVRARVRLVLAGGGEEGTLKPGRDHAIQLLITPVLDEGEEGEGLVEITGPVSLRIQWSKDGEGARHVKVEHPEIRVRPEDVAGVGNGLLFPVSLKVEAEVIVVGRLQVFADSALGSATWLEQKLGFTEEQEAPEEFTKKCDDVQLLLAPEAAGKLPVLFVETQPGQRKLSLLGFHERAGQLVNELPLPPKSLTDLGQGLMFRDIFGRVREYSQHKVKPLIGWLNRVLAFAGPDATLVIYENSDSRVPWEMLELKQLMPLGGELSVVRWLISTVYDDSLSLATGRVAHQGEVLAFVDNQLPHTESEKQALHACNATVHASLEDMFNALNPVAPEVALVFLACDGVITEDGEQQLEQQVPHGEQMVIRKLDLVNVQQPMGPKPMVIVNACHSARMLDDGMGGYTGLPLVCLTQFAGSYMGTLGPVDLDVAGGMGSALLEEAQKGATRIPALLKVLRQKATEALRKAPSDSETVRKYVHTFLYVFYGPPDTWLELSGGSDA